MHLLRITYLDIFDILEEFLLLLHAFFSYWIRLIFQMDKWQRSALKLYVINIYTKTYLVKEIVASTESEEDADGKKEDMLASVAIYD